MSFSPSSVAVPRDLVVEMTLGADEDSCCEIDRQLQVEVAKSLCERGLKS